MAGRFILTHSTVLVLPVHVSYTPVRGGLVHANAASSRPSDGFMTLSTAATQDVPVALVSPLEMSPNPSVAHQQLVETGVEIFTQELVGDIGVAIQLIGRNGSTTSIVTAGVESELSRTTLDRMVPRPGDLIHTAASDLTTPHSVMVLASWEAVLSTPVRLVVSVSPAIGQIPIESWHQFLKCMDTVAMNMRETAVLSLILTAHEPGTGIRNLMKPEAALVHRIGIIGRELQHEQGAERVQVPAFETRIAGTAGVGDAYIATVRAVLLKGKDIEEACSLANATAVIAISHEPTLPVPTLERILRVVREEKAAGLTSQRT